MKTHIEVYTHEGGNPRRGYHDYTTNVNFRYDTEVSYTADKERAIVESIIGTAANWMWYRLTNPQPGSWQASYGYDSGD